MNIPAIAGVSLTTNHEERDGVFSVPIILRPGLAAPTAINPFSP